MLEKRSEDLGLRARVRDLLGDAEHDDGAIIHRVVEGRAREHEPVDDRRGHAHGRAAAHDVKHPVRVRAVEIEPLADTRMHGRQHVRLPVDGESDVADQRLVQHSVDRLAIVDAALGTSLHGRARRARFAAHCCLLDDRGANLASEWTVRKYRFGKDGRTSRGYAQPSGSLITEI